jgi:molybdenum cofactor guanylyltransferase
MLGVILCGGQSSRMGSDKGLLTLESTTWAQAAANKLTALSLPVIVSVNHNQFNDYNKLFPAQQLVTDTTVLQLKGPLLGVLSAHLHNTTEDLLVIACDMPLMETSILKELIKTYKNQQADAYVFNNGNEPEPLCGIYTARGLAHIIELHNNGQLTRHSMKFILEQLRTYYQPMSEEQKKYFRNFNAHATLNGL